MSPTHVIARLARLRVPRYTSYPTAVAFSEAVSPTVYQQWLSEIEEDTPLSLYTHVPFCQSLCHYCGCHMTVTQRREPLERYLEHLLKEILSVARHLPPGLPVHHLHFGGGTPSVMTGDDLSQLMAAFEAMFDLSYPGDYAMELDPRTVSQDLVDSLAGWGFNRISLGVQDIHPAVQKAIHRHQPFEVVQNAADMLRGAGLENINMDVMYGLPLQTVASVQETVKALLDLAPARLAVFGYAHVPWMKTHQKVLEQYGLPDAMARYDQAQAIHEALLSAGYMAIGIDHYARPDDSLAVALKAGKLRRNFQGYTDDVTPMLLGFGASAIGYLPQGYVQNAPRIDTYGMGAGAAELSDTDGLVTARGLALSSQDRVIATAIERLMCDLTVDLAHVAKQHGVRVEDAFAHVPVAYASLQDFGIVTFEAWRVTVPEPARLYARIASGILDPNLDWPSLLQEQDSALRHSVAI